MIDTNLISQPGPRVVPIRNMAEVFHPEAFRNASNGTATEGESTGGSGTGFTVVAPALALAVGAALLRLRE